MKLTNENYTVYLFQPMQGISVERTFCNLLYVYGRGLFLFRAEILPLVGNAHRAFRGKKHGRMPCGRATVKHYIVEKITQSIVSTNATNVRRTCRFRRAGVVPFFLQAENTGECRAVGRRVNHKIDEKICLLQPLIKIVISEYRFLNCYA